MAAATRLPPSPFLLCYLKDALLFPRSMGEVRGCSWPHEGGGQSSLTHRKKIAQGLIAVVCKLVSLST